MSQRGGFPGLKDGCRWCLCVDRSVRLNPVAEYADLVQVEGSLPSLYQARRQGRPEVCPLTTTPLHADPTPRVDLSSTAHDALKTVKLEDLRRFEYKSSSNPHNEL